MNANTVSPEAALKQAEQFEQEGNWDQAVVMLHQALQNKKNKGNNSTMERVMFALIDICVKNNSTVDLRENLQIFRNSFQHQSMQSLETVFKYLIKENNKILAEIEKKEGVEKISLLLNDDASMATGEQALFQSGEATPEQLLLLANCDIDELLERNRLLPRINFFLETYKTILDTLRQNNRLMDLYNQAANKLLEFCFKYKCKKEFLKVSKILQDHFGYILKAAKLPDQNKIPYPVTLKDDECTDKLLELRQSQLEYALRMEEWTDAFRTCETIFALINRRDKHVQKQILQQFYTQLASIFWKSGNDLFHTYALLNQLKFVRQSTTKTPEQKQLLACQLVLSALSVPLNNKICNFQRLSTVYMPKDMEDAVENSSQVKQEILNVSQMLNIQGFPSRQSLISQINLKNQFQVSGCPSVGALFKLIEFEDSPFTIAQQGPLYLEQTLKTHPELESYGTLIKRTLAVRILQKSKAFYTSLTFKTLVSQLQFFGPWEKIESLLFECNREGLVKTIVDHANAIISFDQEVQVAESLLNFGTKLRSAFAKIAETKTQGQERLRIFLKVKEKLDEETKRVQDMKLQMTQNKELITKDLQQEMENLLKLREKEEQEKRIQFEIQKQKDETMRKRNELMDKLNSTRQTRARQVLQELKDRGYNKVGNDRIETLLKREDDLDYDFIMTFFQNVRRLELERLEVAKNKKVNDVEIWSRAVKEEECLAMRDYCDKNGNAEMENIRKAIKEKHAKELETKHALQSASQAFNTYKQGLLQMRRQILADQQLEFAKKQGQLVKEEIIKEAAEKLKVIEIRRDNEAAALKRKQLDLERQAKLKAEGKAEPRYDGKDDTPDSWGRGTQIQEAKRAAQEYEAQQKAREARPPREPENNDFTRGQNVVKAEQKPIEFTRKPREEGQDTGFQRSTMMAKTEETKQASGPPKFTNSKKEGPPTFTRGTPKAPVTKPESTPTEPQKQESFGSFRSNIPSKANEPAQSKPATTTGGGFQKSDSLRKK